MLGARYASVIKTGRLILGPPDTPSAQETQFGLLLSGPIETFPGSLPCHNGYAPACCNFGKVLDTEEPEAPSKLPRCKEDTTCENIFKITTNRDPTGRYVVSLPIRESHPTHGNPLAVATKRLHAVERRMAFNPRIRSQYLNYFKGHIAGGIVEVIPKTEIHKGETQCYYMYYHEVLKESSSSTRVRVVSDCPAKTTQGPSLNEILLPGPKLQVDLLSLMIRFRSYPVAISGDIPKFFNQVEVSQGHQDFQRLLFRESTDLPLTHFWMKRLSFGLTPAPFLASGTLQQLFDDECYDPGVIDIVKNETLVENVLTGAFTVPKALSIQQELIRTLKKGRMELREWASDVPALLDQIPLVDREIKMPLEISDDAELPTFGVKWNPLLDTVQRSILNFKPNQIADKRPMLSVIACIFDPQGWLSPVTVRPKLFIQELWKGNGINWNPLEWDTPPPAPLQINWKRILHDLPILEKFQLNRCYSPVDPCNLDKENPLSYDLVGFSDARNCAFSAIVYLRVTDLENRSSVSLVGAKTKVAPVKGETIPRLELNGTRLLSRFLKIVLDSLPYEVDSVSFYSDSTSVLGQLNPDSQEKRDVFVNNRVRTIHQTLPNASWYHVAEAENPADCASRRIFATDFLSNPLWLHGPTWLQDMKFPKTGLRSYVAAIDVKSNRIMSLILKTSSYSKLLHTVAFIIRFCNVFTSKPRIAGSLLNSELDAALVVVVRSVRECCFQGELSHADFKRLAPFLDDNKIIRVGGRLSNANITTDKKYPILLPKKHHLSKIVARYYHVKHLHAGPNLLLSLIRDRFWIIGGACLAKQMVRECVTCHRLNPRVLTQIMGNLPRPRLMLTRPFTDTAMDFAGPFTVAVTTGRNPRLFKCYFCVYVCMAVKAVHIELVTDLSTPAFLASLQRFASRRGGPNSLYSDGGMNFVGASNELKKVVAFLGSQALQDGVQHFCNESGITFHFNSPLTPHHAVKSVKRHLYAVIGNRPIHRTVQHSSHSSGRYFELTTDYTVV